MRTNENAIQTLEEALNATFSEREWLRVLELFAPAGIADSLHLRTSTGMERTRLQRVLDSQEKLLKLELADKNLLVGDRGNKLLEFIEQYRKRLAKGLDWLQNEPQTPKEAEKRFKARRKIVDAIVGRVDLFLISRKNKSSKLHLGGYK
jgi:hypothetical protein